MKKPKSKEKTAMEIVLTGRFSKENMKACLYGTKGHFEETLELALQDEQPLCWRAAWLLVHCMKRDDLRVKKKLKKILKVMPEKADGHQRELLKILEKMTLSEDDEGVVFDYCMTIWENLSKSPSVRITAFKHLLRVALKYPELKEEFDYLVSSDYTETLSPGVRRSVEIMLQKQWHKKK